MKTVVYERYGPPEVLQFRDVAKPTAKDNEVLVKTLATTVTSGDWRVRSLSLPPGFGPMGRLAFGILRPRQPVLGSELAGEVQAVGKAVTRFKPGDAVFAFTDVAMGCHAEFRCIPEDGLLALKPPGLTFAEAAALSFGGTTALSFFRRAKLQPGERVLVNGASGSVGTAAVQLARHFGAHVTGVCSAANAELVRGLGASQVIDYAAQDFTQLGQSWDVVMDTAGTAPYSRSGAVLNAGGRLLMVLGGLADMLHAPCVNLSTRHKVVAGPVAVRPEDLQLLAGLAQAGEFKPVVDRCYPFEQIVDAHRHVDTGRKRGNVVVLLAPNAAANIEP